MALSIDAVDVERMGDETGLKPDDIRAAFDVHTANDRALTTALLRTRSFTEVRDLLRDAEPDTESVRYQLVQALADMARTRDELMEVLQVYLLPERIAQSTYERLLNTRGVDTDDLVDIATDTQDPATAHRAIRMLAEQFLK
jgi:hypothetical protein